MSTRGHWDGPVICNQGTRYKVEPFVGTKMWIIAIIAIILRIIPIIAFSLYGLFAPDSFQTAFPPSSLPVISSHFEFS